VLNRGRAIPVTASLSPDDEITVLYVIPETPLSGAGGSYSVDLKQIKQEIAPKILDATIEELKDLKAKIKKHRGGDRPSARLLS
jgi:hypothetical protein